VVEQAAGDHALLLWAMVDLNHRPLPYQERGGCGRLGPNHDERRNCLTFSPSPRAPAVRSGRLRLPVALPYSADILERRGGDRARHSRRPARPGGRSRLGADAHAAPSNVRPPAHARPFGTEARTRRPTLRAHRKKGAGGNPGTSCSWGRPRRASSMGDGRPGCARGSRRGARGADRRCRAFRTLRLPRGGCAQSTPRCARSRMRSRRSDGTVDRAMFPGAVGTRANAPRKLALLEATCNHFK